MDKIHMTEKAFRIRNCCRFINEPWTSEEIAEIWGLPKKRIEHSEESGRRKLYRSSLAKLGDPGNWAACRQRQGVRSGKSSKRVDQ